MINGQFGRNGARNAGQQELLSYLGKLGLKDADMAKCIRYLDDHLPEDLIQVRHGGDLAAGTVGPNPRRTASKIRNIGLYLAEEQQVLRGPYEAFFSTHPAIKLLGSSEDVAGDSLIASAMVLKPDVILLGVKALRPAMLDCLHNLREEYNDVGLVLLTSSYDNRAFKSLRSIPIGGSMGTAYLLKHTIDTLDQVARIIRLVAEGRIIVDPMVMTGLFNAERTFIANPRILLAMDTWDVGSPALDSGNETDGNEAAGRPRSTQGNLEDACAALEEGGICIDRAVFQALVCLAASGLLSSRPKKWK